VSSKKKVGANLVVYPTFIIRAEKIVLGGIPVRDYWVNRKQVLGFIGSMFIIFGTFLPVYTLNLPFLDQVSISLLDFPLRPVAFILITMSIVSILALGFREYPLLYLSGFVSLIAVLTLFIGVELGFVMLSANLPKVSAVVEYVFDHDIGWIFLLTGCALLLVTPRLED
jgi:hypothetical protein